MSLPSTIQADTIRLRRFRPADTPQTWIALEESRANVAPWMPALAETAVPAAIDDWIAAGRNAWLAGQAYDFAITTTIDPTLILGGCGLALVSRSHHYANLYYWVRAAALGRGVAPAAARQLARFGLDQLALQRIEILVACANTASLRAVAKTGATLEGCLRNRLWLHGRAHDAMLYAFVRADIAPGGMLSAVPPVADTATGS
jgi:ribosomal-protein-serine acetyltransferase